MKQRSIQYLWPNLGKHILLYYMMGACNLPWRISILSVMQRKQTFIFHFSNSFLSSASLQFHHTSFCCFCLYTYTSISNFPQAKGCKQKVEVQMLTYQYQGWGSNVPTEAEIQRGQTASHLLNVAGKTIGPIYPDNGHHFKEGQVHEGDGSCVVVNQVEVVDASLQIEIDHCESKQSSVGHRSLSCCSDP